MCEIARSFLHDCVVTDFRRMCTESCNFVCIARRLLSKKQSSREDRSRSIAGMDRSLDVLTCDELKPLFAYCSVSCPKASSAK